MVTPNPETSVVDEIVEADGVPLPFFDAFRAILTSRDIEQVRRTSADAIFTLIDSGVVTFSDKRPTGEFRINKSFRDREVWDHKLDQPIAPNAITHLIAQTGKPAVRHATVRGSRGFDPWFLDYLDLYGVPFLFDDQGDVTWTLTVGMQEGHEPVDHLVFYMQLVASAASNAIGRIASLEAALETGQALEREYILQELHDSAIQDIFACELGIMGLMANVEKGSRIETGLEHCLIHAQSANRSIRTLLRNQTHREDSRSVSLKAIIEAEVTRHTESSNVPVETVCDADIALSGAAARATRMLVHEGLCNVRKHSGASGAVVMASVMGDMLLICVADDGKGFDIEDHLGEDDRWVPHFGLGNLNEVAHMAGGTLDIETAPDEGTTLRMRLPLNFRKEETR